MGYVSTETVIGFGLPFYVTFDSVLIVSFPHQVVNDCIAWGTILEIVNPGTAENRIHIMTTLIQFLFNSTYFGKEFALGRLPYKNIIT